MFRWDFSKVDTKGKWGIDKVKCSFFLHEIWDKIRDYEGRRWKEVLADNHRVHVIPVGSIVRTAQKRLQELKCDEYNDHLLSFRLSGLFSKKIWLVLGAGAVRNRTYRGGRTGLFCQFRKR